MLWKSENSLHLLGQKRQNIFRWISNWVSIDIPQLDACDLQGFWRRMYLKQFRKQFLGSPAEIVPSISLGLIKSENARPNLNQRPTAFALTETMTSHMNCKLSRDLPERKIFYFAVFCAHMFIEPPNNNRIRRVRLHLLPPPYLYNRLNQRFSGENFRPFFCHVINHPLRASAIRQPIII